MSDDGILGDLYSYESLLTDDERKELRGIREFLQTEVRPPPEARPAHGPVPEVQGCRHSPARAAGLRRVGTPRAAPWGAIWPTCVMVGARVCPPALPRRTTGVPWT